MLRVRYKDYHKLICKLAWQATCKFPFEFDTLLSEGNLIFAQKRKKFDRKKAKFQTYLYHCVSGHYKNMNRLQNKVTKNCIEVIDPCSAEKCESVTVPRIEANQEKQLIKHEQFKELSSEAKEVIDIVLNAPKEILEVITAPSKEETSKKRLRPYLAKKWGRAKVNKIFDELKEFTKTF